MAKVDGAVAMMAKGQAADGYLNSHYQTVEPENRFTNLRDCHELYCAGHLIEAAIAYYEATGKRAFLEVMCRYADCIATVFGRGEGQRKGYCGHEEIELALVRLYRATGAKKYLDLAEYFINERGSKPHYFDEEAKARGEAPGSYWAGATYEYCQAHVPVRDIAEIGGHSVRAMYLLTGMAAVAGATGDASLHAACKRLWTRLVQRRLHVTGGLGAVCRNEGFTTDYDLPNEGAYLETCAAIGLIFWAQRMMDWGADSRYSDVVEQALYNGSLCGVSADGARFFYGNPLAAYPGFNGDGVFVKEGYHYRRSEWFGCACCPPNVARLIANVPSLLYTSRAATVELHQFAASEARLFVAGMHVTVTQTTDYPWDGTVAVTVDPEQEKAWTLAIRIPGWCRDARLRVNGKGVALKRLVKKGYASLKRKWQKGDTLTLVLAMPVERIEARPDVRQNCGRVALKRGPIVYCIEETDNGKHLNNRTLSRDSQFTVRRGTKGILKGVPVIAASAAIPDASRWKPGELYRSGTRTKSRPCTLTAIPYYLWGNRTPGEMQVWIRFNKGSL